MKAGVLDHAVDALRALGDDRDDAAASATRMRIRDSLTRGHALRRHSVALVTLAVLLVASGAWALSSGRVERWLAPAAQAPATLPEPSEPITGHPTARVTITVHDAPSVEASHAPHEAHAIAPRTTAVRASEPSRSEALYRAAHDLHFHDGDAAAALAAWDAYLAAAPHGAFAIEARYNRALCLVRLGRLADARAALEPFARGVIEPAGYRQSDAAHLIERIDHRLNGTR
jgi:tetratricopeptide (TPR) repeat protein